MICLGAAGGLEYLHSGRVKDNKVVHRDVKSANILLDENMEAKICDFGMSKAGQQNQQSTGIYTKVAGTPYYMDPIYQESGKLITQSDMHSKSHLFIYTKGKQQTTSTPGTHISVLTSRDSYTKANATNEKAAENRPSNSASQEGGHFSFVDTQIIDADRDARRQVQNRASISTIENRPSSPAFQEDG
nr:protein kinase-like domain-containing protein [Tanacetum cinerariifolium]